MVTFTENTGSEVCVVLGVNEDGEFEGAETLIVRLVSADNPLMIDSAMDLATITILDIEGEWTIIIIFFQNCYWHFNIQGSLGLHVNIITVCQ